MLVYIVFFANLLVNSHRYFNNFSSSVTSACSAFSSPCSHLCLPHPSSQNLNRTCLCGDGYKRILQPPSLDESCSCEDGETEVNNTCFKGAHCEYQPVFIHLRQSFPQIFFFLINIHTVYLFTLSTKIVVLICHFITSEFKLFLTIVFNHSLISFSFLSPHSSIYVVF